MPAYAYACPACSATLDVLKKMEDAAAAESCPECSQTMTRVYASAAAVKVNGGTPRFHVRKQRRA